MTVHTHTFKKVEHICSKKQIDALFTKGGSKAMTAYPVRVVYRLYDQPETPPQPHAQVLISVPKKYFKRAVKRNRVKRQIREAYRLQKQVLLTKLPAQKHIDLAFIWISDSLEPTNVVMERIGLLLTRLAERLAPQEEQG